MVQASQGFLSGEQLITALNERDPVKIGLALTQLRHLCSTKPLPAVLIDYHQSEPAVDSIFNILNVAREANSIQLLANALYTLSYLLSRSSTSPFETRQLVDGSRIINHLIQNHSKSIHRCFAPGRTEATLACLSLLTSCVCWNDQACAKIIINDLRWDHKTVTRLLHTRSSPVTSNGTSSSNQNNHRTHKSSKLQKLFHKAHIRSLMLRFIFSIVSSTELRTSVKQEFWRTRGLADGVLKGLQADSYETVAFVLGHLWDDVVSQNIGNGLNHRRSYHSGFEIFDQNAIMFLVQLLDRDDDTKDIQNATLPVTETVAQMVERFLKNLSVYLSNFVSRNIFQHHSNSRLLQYRTLLNLVKCLTPTKSMRRWRLALCVLESVPTLCSAIWRTAAPPIEPSPTLTWMTSVGFATKVAAMPLTLSLEVNTRCPTSDSISILTNLAGNLLAQCFPTPLNRLWFTKALQHSNSLVSFSALTLLLTGLKKARSILWQLEHSVKPTAFELVVVPDERYPKLGMAFQRCLRAILPDAQVLIAILQTTARRQNEHKSANTDHSDQFVGESHCGHLSRPLPDNGVDSDIVAFCSLASLSIYHQLIPQTMYNTNFDYTKLISSIFKLNLSNEFNQPESTSHLILHRLQSPIAYLNQSRTLLLIGHSALTSPTPPSPALMSVLLLLSSFPKTDKFQDPTSMYHTPDMIKRIAQATLHAICNSIVPHLRDQREYQELYIWICTLSELRKAGESVTPLITFLDDCIRAYLRNPLKYLQISAEHRREYPQWQNIVRIPTLLSALLVKIGAVIKGSTISSINSSRAALLSTVIKFLNLYLFMVLSMSHETHPFLMIHYISTQLHPMLSNFLTIQADHCLKLPDYLGHTIINILRSGTQALTSIDKSSPKNISWPLYVTQSSFCNETNFLDSMYQLLSSSEQKSASMKRKKSVAFTDLTISGEQSAQSNQHQLRSIRFMTRAFEVAKFSIDDFIPQESKDLPGNIQLFDSKKQASNTKFLVELMGKSLKGDPVVNECFLEGIWHICQSIVENENFELLQDILRASCFGLTKSDHEEVKIFDRYCDLLSNTILSYSKSAVGTGKSTVATNALIQCACYLFPLLSATQQAKILITLFSCIDHTALSDKSCAGSISKLISVALALPSRDKQSVLDQLSVEPVISTLCALSGAGQIEAATNTLLEIVEGSFAAQAPLRYSEAPFQALSNYAVVVLESSSQDQSDFTTKLRIVSHLAQKDRKTALAATQWLSCTSISEIKHIWIDALRLLVACLEGLPPDESRYKFCLMSLGKNRLEELITIIGSCLFSPQSQTSDLVSFNGSEHRVLAAKALKLVCSCTESLVNQLLAEQITKSDLIPAYSEALDTLRTTLTLHLVSYVDRCLKWLVRRLAEDEHMTLDTEKLVESFRDFLSHQPPDYTLSAHLVNPVLSVALDRFLDSGCVMKLVDLLIIHTKLREADILKHVRATVESRSFRTIMKSSHQVQDGQDSLVMLAIRRLVTSYPRVTIQATLSKTLIPFYGGTMSLKDRTMFQIFRIEDLWSETLDIDQVFAAWKPLIGNKTSSTKPLDFVTLIDSNKVEVTSSWLLTRPKLKSLSSLPSYYDPSFLLALFLHIIENEGLITISSWNSISRSGLLGLAMCALSSDRTSWRFLGDRCLTKSYQILKSSDHSDALEILLPIEHFRSLFVMNDEEGKIRDVPPLMTLFLSRCLRVFCTTPESSLYQPLSRFLLQRATIDAKDVPMLYSLLYSSGDLPSEGHIWLIEILRDGLCRSIDFRIMNHRQTLDILITLVLSSSHRSAPKLRYSFLQLLRKATAHNQPCMKLIGKSGLLKVLKQFKPSRIESKEIILILQEVVSRIVLLHPQISRESVESILEILAVLNKVEDRDHNNITNSNSDSLMIIDSLTIIRSILTCHSSWTFKNSIDPKIEKETTKTILSKILSLARNLSDRLISLNCDLGQNVHILIQEIFARILYLEDF